MYGQTEASPRMSYLDYKYALEKIGSIGKPIPNTEMWIENENNEKIKNINEVGQLVFKGKNVFMGYAEGWEDLDKKNQNKKILYTGDLAKFDKDGFFYLIGRLKRIAKVFGNRINMDEIQNRMMDIGFEIACIEKNNKILVYYESDFDIDFIRNKFIEVTGQNNNIFKIIKISKMPRTINQKINYSELEQFDKC